MPKIKVSKHGLFSDKEIMDGVGTDYARNLALTKLDNTDDSAMGKPLERQPELASFDVLYAEALRFLSVQGVKEKEAVEELNQLSCMQIKGLMKLYSKGMRGSDLRAYRSDFHNTLFGDAHICTLKLLAEKGITGSKAIEEITELTLEQVRYVALGKNRQEALKITFGLFTAAEIWGGEGTDYARRLALTKLGKTGLTMEHLLEWQPGPDSFDVLHTRALGFLSEQSVYGKDAVEEINKLSFMQIKALMKFYSKGMRGSDLRAYRSDIHNTPFGDAHIDTLKRLAKKGVTGLKAIEEIAKLTVEQVRLMALGKNREEVFRFSLGLFTHAEILGGEGIDYARNLALTKLGNTGLTKEHLEDWQPGPDSFDVLHARALGFLSEQGVYGKEAIEEINQLSFMQLRVLWHLYPSMRGSDLRAYRCDLNNTSFGPPHIYALKCLAKKGVTGLKAIEEITELTIEQVRHVARGKNRVDALKEHEGPQSNKIPWFWGQSMEPAIEGCEESSAKIAEPVLISSPKGELGEADIGRGDEALLKEIKAYRKASEAKAFYGGFEYDRAGPI